MALSLRAVKRNFGDFILGPIDLEVGRGERVAVVGPQDPANPRCSASWRGLSSRTKAVYI